MPSSLGQMAMESKILINVALLNPTNRFSFPPKPDQCWKIGSLSLMNSELRLYGLPLIQKKIAKPKLNTKFTWRYFLNPGAIRFHQWKSVTNGSQCCQLCYKALVLLGMQSRHFKSTNRKGYFVQESIAPNPSSGKNLKPTSKMMAPFLRFFFFFFKT